MEELSDKVRLKKCIISSHLNTSQELREIFQAIDTDNSQTLTLSEVNGLSSSHTVKTGKLFKYVFKEHFDALLIIRLPKATLYSTCL